MKLLEEFDEIVRRSCWKSSKRVLKEFTYD